jgi:phosphoribosyl 1,2-cyclic phosphodiesterase
MSLTVRFWGVRGSVPTPGPDTAGVGGNTSCVEVACGDQRVILDAGTGLRRLGDALVARDAPVAAAVLFSHVHWDHIQGLPFFAPLFRPTTTLDLYAAPDARLAEALHGQMNAPSFPVDLRDVPATLRFHDAAPGSGFRVGPIEITAAALNHPNGVLAYRLDCEGRSVVYATDTEHHAHGGVDQALVELARGADLLIYDAQYTPDEYCGAVGPCRRGWGHSTWPEGVRVAREAQVKRLALFHHDPSHDDAAVAAIEAAAARELPPTIAAREGMTLTLASVQREAAA